MTLVGEYLNIILIPYPEPASAGGTSSRPTASERCLASPAAPRSPSRLSFVCTNTPRCPNGTNGYYLSSPYTPLLFEPRSAPPHTRTSVPTIVARSSAQDLKVQSDRHFKWSLGIWITEEAQFGPHTAAYADRTVGPCRDPAQDATTAALTPMSTIASPPFVSDSARGDVRPPNLGSSVGRRVVTGERTRVILRGDRKSVV